jgi:hypothetical protein
VETVEARENPDAELESARLPPTRVFLAKSAEWHEKKGLKFCLGAKKSKRVRKGLKRQGIGDGEQGIATKGSR